MILGILSDSHGHVARSRAAVQLLLTRGAEVLIHCGDIGSEEALSEMAALVEPRGIPLYAVLGNVDWDELGMGSVHVLGRHGEVHLDGRKAAIVHGDDAAALRSAIACGRYDYVFTGHTHLSADTRAGRTRVINPGAIYRASTPSVAVLNTAADLVEIVSL